jgi:hypothetical protein
VHPLIAKIFAKIYISTQIAVILERVMPNRMFILPRASRCLVLITAAIGFLQSSSQAQFGTDTHTVTVQVDQITAMSVDQSALNMVIDGTTAIAGQDLMVATDETSSIFWGTNVSAQKVTVNTSLAAPLFTLRVVAVGPTTGNEAPEVTLTTTPSDFILDIGRSSGMARIRYTGQALASQGTGTDAHVITFTVVAQ